MIFFRDRLKIGPFFCFIICLLLLLATALSPASAVAPPVHTLQEVNPSLHGTPDIDAEAFYLYDATSQTSLAGKDFLLPLPPASMTKVMTVLLALEHLDPDDEILVSKEMFVDIPNDYTRLGIVEGEIISVRDALYASMLISANDTSLALALKISGSLEAFADLMNQRAEELGCTDTHFTNAYGYSDPDHLLSARDMALILAKALEYDSFRELANTPAYTMQPTNLWENFRGMNNGNNLLSSKASGYPHFIGGKTGYTDLSQNTLVAGAEKDGRILIATVMGEANRYRMFEDIVNLFEHGFSDYELFEHDDANLKAVAEQARKHLQDSLPEGDLTFEIPETEPRLSGNALTLPKYLLEQGARPAYTFTAPSDLPNFSDIKNSAEAVVYPLQLTVAENFTYPVGEMIFEVTAHENTQVSDTFSYGPDSPEKPISKSLVRTLLILGAILLSALLVLFLAYYLIFMRSCRKRRKGKVRVSKSRGKQK